MNITSVIAVLAAVTWIASELVELTAGTFTDLSLALTVAAFAGLAIGVWGMGGRVASTRGWRAVVAVTSLGLALMAAVAVQMWAGVGGHDGPLFGAAVATFTVGLVGMTALAARGGRHPRWAAIGLGAGLALVMVGQGGEVAAVASAANVVLALTLAALAVPGLGLRRAAPVGG